VKEEGRVKEAVEKKGDGRRRRVVGGEGEWWEEKH
jgi:hypothetical protein